MADPDIQIRGAPGPSPRSATGALIKSDKSPLQNSYIFLDRSLSKILFRVGIPRGTPLYYGHICMFPPRRVWFLVLFGLKTGMQQRRYALCPFWSGIGYGFRGNYGSV